ncbi:nucleoside phosphorylase domain-containing protein [Talaromyces proteolyticus]|uniref:Nucleoside phosphorylase domain-containing protein n=1 Tax=Talaromyces proteolyticus TaxID=1131652 RepID=A0AAD4PU93_9EURO|nr:nucleoside phosphorylase domain-containing protein [Talaromyces proteolyticus]KAH8689075.1 nucleoside phosphorylase domain-containing protein [Talaromyces proteolyticus]
MAARAETRKSEDYYVACFTVIPEEFAAFREMCDERHSRPLGIDPRDPNQYDFGEIAGHNVVLCCASRPGPDNIAATAADLLRSFEGIKYALLVGIGGGVPSRAYDVRLGDIVVATPGYLTSGITHHDQGKQLSDRFKHLNFPVPPPRALQGAVGQMQTRELVGRSKIPNIISSVVGKLPNFNRPDNRSDCLFQADYEHVGERSDCDECDKKRLVQRSARDNLAPRIHYGVIASGSLLVRSAEKRDSLRDLYNVCCIDMEAAGIMGTLPSLVIRGIGDYADSHKNDHWQKYAAVAAAAYAKELLQYLSSPVAGSRFCSDEKSGESMATTQTRNHTVEDLLEQKARIIRAYNWRESIIDLSKVLGLKWDLGSRPQLAQALQVNKGPNGSEIQNNALRCAIMKELRVENENIVIPSHLQVLRN